MMLAVYHVAEPADRHAHDERVAADVQQARDREVVAVGVDGAADLSADDGAPDREAALDEAQDRNRVGGVILPGVDHVKEPRPDDPADDTPEGNRHNVVLGEAALDG